jgi:hypothetical protein
LSTGHYLNNSQSTNQQKCQAGELLLSVPRRALRTVQTVPKAISSKIGDISVHGLLAADLCYDSSDTRAPWRAVLPTEADFVETMPYMWESILQNLLPPVAKALLENQQRKFQKDWAAVSKAFPQLACDTYLYNWLIVNTRTFYWVTPGNKKRPPPDDCMALNPFADYFNHADTGCVVEFGPKGFSIVSDRVYEEGEEMYISYGNHSNDFLLAEYGFVLLENRWDEVQLDQVILPKLSTSQRECLEEAGFLGNYMLDSQTICHRSQVALRIICVSRRAWLRFVNGEDDGDRDQQTVNTLLLRLLSEYRITASQSAKQVMSSRSGFLSQRQMLSRRWRQIEDLLRDAITRIQNGR